MVLLCVRFAALVLFCAVCAVCAESAKQFFLFPSFSYGYPRIYQFWCLSMLARTCRVVSFRVVSCRFGSFRAVSGRTLVSRPCCNKPAHLTSVSACTSCGFDGCIYLFAAVPVVYLWCTCVCLSQFFGFIDDKTYTALDLRITGRPLVYMAVLSVVYLVLLLVLERCALHEARTARVMVCFLVRQQ